MSVKGISQLCILCGRKVDNNQCCNLYVTNLKMNDLIAKLSQYEAALNRLKQEVNDRQCINQQLKITYNMFQ